MLFAATCMLLVGTPIVETVDFTDIKDAPLPFIDALESTLSDMTDELGVTDAVVDIVVVGSFAYGIGRPNDPLRQSDIDVVIYLRELVHPGQDYYAAFAAFRTAALRYRKVLQSLLGTATGFDIKVDTRNLSDHVADPDWVGYSLVHRRFYNRDDGQPRFLKGHFYHDVYYVFDRPTYLVFVEDLLAHPKQIHQELEGDQIVFYDAAAWERGEHVEILRSLHKQR